MTGLEQRAYEIVAHFLPSISDSLAKLAKSTAERVEVERQILDELKKKGA